MEKYSELSYRELQSKAKELGIAANKKKEVLLEAILALENQSTTLSSEVDSIEPEMTQSVEITPNIEQLLEQAVKIIQEEAQPIEIVVQEIVDTTEEENILDQSLEYFDSECPEYNEEEEEFHECDTGDLVDAFDNMKLRGIPNPTGIKTVFDFDENTTEKKIDWGIEFEQENAENINTVNKLPIPQGKHTIFSSPDLKMGKATHWTYESFDKKPTVGLSSAVTPSKNMSTEDKMNFWLAKGPKTPLR